MQSLLSQSESNAFQSFLSSMDFTDEAIPAEEWATFSAASASAMGDPDQDIFNDSIQNSEGRRALRKATKDLMSLDTDANWDSSNMNHSPVNHPHFEDQQRHRYQQLPSRHDSFPFLHTKSHQPQQHSTPSAYGFSQQPQPQQQRGQGRDASPETRPERLHTLPSTSSSSVRPPSDPPQKRQRLSFSERQSNTPAFTPATTSAGFSTHNPQSGQHSSKPSLLSPSQKKANHIQSEQKRRTNIRKGYAALCETVPALREAIREEDEAEGVAANYVNGVANRDVVNTNCAGRKKRSKKDPDKDKMDGRTGPRSENMVLSKTIDHIQSLLEERSSLLTRLQLARASLPPGHPALTSLNPDQPWEREWKGGEGKFLGDGDGDEEGSGGEEDE